MDGVPAETFLGTPVRVRGIEIGSVVDVLVDPGGGRVIGFDVSCRDGSNRFLPYSAAAFEGDHIETLSALALGAEDQLQFYRSRAGSLRHLPGAGRAIVAGDGAIEIAAAANDAA